MNLGYRYSVNSIPDNLHLITLYYYTYIMNYRYLFQKFIILNQQQ